ncbi:hypothetical protein [Halioxenophilus sp. WMMB6]|uniref:hypothetical protein n=1 Tax=Halioxenophilus sp. WMMB6 TaxID=3073815 RepID=UPI00295E83B4|nr:hypothetical protein [Halioxenophilus sp. WMMB6]
MQTKIKTRLINWSAILWSMMVLLPLSVAHADKLSETPFWTLNSGLWLSQNTYLGSDLEYKIKSYSSIVDIAVSANGVVIVERKFYPPGAFHGKALGLDIADDVGVELLQTTRWLAEGDDGRVVAEGDVPGPYQFSITPYTGDTAVLAVTNRTTKRDSYRMMISLPSPNYRYVVNMGIDDGSKDGSIGALRGLSFFNGQKITQESLTDHVNKLRQLHQIKAQVLANPDGSFELAKRQ